mmetsp:Transcript_685/g.1554  ORF Transcript_685/g.1554 Transcript_685/m.1554 type:complete len:95 (-) Transcript_685:468-752(-)
MFVRPKSPSCLHDGDGEEEEPPAHHHHDHHTSSSTTVVLLVIGSPLNRSTAITRTASNVHKPTEFCSIQINQSGLEVRLVLSVYLYLLVSQSCL